MAAGGSDGATLEAARLDAGRAVFEYDDARAWLAEQGSVLRAPLAVEVWVFAPALDSVVLVHHRWRDWVPPGGTVEVGELPREAAMRELTEETGLRAELATAPAAVAVRSYKPKWSATLGISFAAIVDTAQPLLGEPGQAVAWRSLAEPWPSVFPDDVVRMRAYADWLRSSGAAGG